MVPSRTFYAKHQYSVLLNCSWNQCWSVWRTVFSLIHIYDAAAERGIWILCWIIVNKGYSLPIKSRWRWMWQLKASSRFLLVRADRATRQGAEGAVRRRQRQRAAVHSESGALHVDDPPRTRARHRDRARPRPAQPGLFSSTYLFIDNAVGAQALEIDR